LSIQHNNRILGIDYGEKRLGIAISDDTNTIATPLKYIDNNKEILSRLNKLINKYNIKTLVVGLPINLDGSHSKSSKKVLKFCKYIKKELDIIVHTTDERLSSIEAENKLRESGRSPNMFRNLDRGIIDSASAAIILNSFIQKKEPKLYEK
tara:strand:- start:160 stop:612 length:453 start_codon:yes stop_codon:yes gene_type:complete